MPIQTIIQATTKEGTKFSFVTGMIKQVDYEHKVIWFNNGSFYHFEKIEEKFSYPIQQDIRVTKQL